MNLLTYTATLLVSKQDENQAIQWHKDLYNEGKTNVMITGFTDVYSELKKSGYPVYRLEPTIPLIKVAYKQLKSKYALNKAQYSQIAVEILSFADNKNDIEYYYSN